MPHIFLWCTWGIKTIVWKYMNVFIRKYNHPKINVLLFVMLFSFLTSLPSLKVFVGEKTKHNLCMFNNDFLLVTWIYRPRSRHDIYGMTDCSFFTDFLLVWWMDFFEIMCANEMRLGILLFFYQWKLKYWLTDWK